MLFDVALVFTNMYFLCLDFSQTLDAFTFPKLSVVLPITTSSSPLSLSLSLSLSVFPPDLIFTSILHQYARDLLVVWCECAVSASADGVHFFPKNDQYFIFFSTPLSFFTLIVLFGCYIGCITGVAFRVNEPSNTELIKHFLSVN